MKYLQTHKELGYNKETVFKDIIENLADSIYTWDYFVDWQKVEKQFKENSNQINELDKYASKEDLVTTLSERSDLRRTLLLLLAVRYSHLSRKQILTESGPKDYRYLFKKTKKNVPKKDLEKFLEKSGLGTFLKNKPDSLQSYLKGVLVGLDTNARKNRGGKLMEIQVENILEDILPSHKYIVQATPKKIRQKWGIKPKTNHVDTRGDFATWIDEKLTIIEANYYSSGGSKLSAIAGQYQEKERFYEEANIRFVWVTDGKGWETAKSALKEATENIHYVFNLHLAQNGALEEILL